MFFCPWSAKIIIPIDDDSFKKKRTKQFLTWLTFYNMEYIIDNKGYRSGFYLFNCFL